MTDAGLGVVAALARYPVKSMLGEDLDEARLDGRGLSGDRSWAVYTADGGIASGKTTRRFRRVEGLLAWRAQLDGSEPVVVSPYGETAVAGTPTADAMLTRALGQPLRLRREQSVSHFDDCGVHLVTTSALRALERLVAAPVDARRFRANVVVECPGDDFREDGWSGRDVAIGDAVLRLGPAMPRCVMVDMAQGDLPADGRILRSLGPRDVAFGLQATVVRPGTVHRDDVVRLV